MDRSSSNSTCDCGLMTSSASISCSESRLAEAGSGLPCRLKNSEICSQAARAVAVPMNNVANTTPATVTSITRRFRRGATGCAGASTGTGGSGMGKGPGVATEQAQCPLLPMMQVVEERGLNHLRRREERRRLRSITSVAAGLRICAEAQSIAWPDGQTIHDAAHTLTC